MEERCYITDKNLVNKLEKIKLRKIGILLEKAQHFAFFLPDISSKNFDLRAISPDFPGVMGLKWSLFATYFHLGLIWG